jgi:UDPglucose--hexose-1-phosphate uridylyltransferase
LKDALVKGTDITSVESIAKHADWVSTFIGKYDNITEENAEAILQEEIGEVFKKILECAGVYKRDEAGKAAFLRFVDYVNER